MYNLTSLSEEQVAIILQAIEYYRYNNKYITLEQWNIADTIIAKIEDLI